MNPRSPSFDFGSLTPDGLKRSPIDSMSAAPPATGLDAMQRHLEKNPFLAAGAFSIADIALYAYTHVAHEGGFDLEGYPAITKWLERVAAQPGHITIDA